jgi:oxygen-dependent protoporphyrinogen oxidase
MGVTAAVVGAGITGLAAASWLEHDHGITDLLVLEASDRAGGKVYSELHDGHCLEWGPQGFLDNAPATIELAELVGLEDQLVRADDAAADRYILRNGLLRTVPTSPIAFLGSDILPLPGRLRVLAEPFIRRRSTSGDESVFDFARRRIGRRAATILVDAMVTGVFAGDSRKLSLAATFPRMAAMEAEHGSLTRAMLARLREARAGGRKSGGPAGPGGTLCTFKQGMGQLTGRLAERLGDRLRLSCPVERVERHDRRFRLTGPGLVVEADRLLLAPPATVAAGLLAPLVPAAVAPLQSIPVAPIAVVMSSYTDPDAFSVPLDGFGFLVPGSEQIPILGTLFCHAIFPNQAPTGSLLLRTMLAGARDPAAVELDDDALGERTRQALRSVTGRNPEPDQTWIIRHQAGISQYTIGHLGRVKTAEEAARSIGIELAGSPYRGVSVNDCIRQARTAASRLAE